ncbi:vegetative cell wall protein gp1-like [Onychostruthus taczanowskii]|uniref:vegetative cell wall protein gp1-like n=1 Tax=Onychostruthus taczanowskii TaxID=356909 RepID=UPI001B80E09B|nr:vegetative cell wall protein gp1-like [Onychostruthus taczanowskii]
MPAPPISAPAPVTAAKGGNRAGKTRSAPGAGPPRTPRVHAGRWQLLDRLGVAQTRRASPRAPGSPLRGTSPFIPAPAPQPRPRSSAFLPPAPLPHPAPRRYLMAAPRPPQPLPPADGQGRGGPAPDTPPPAPRPIASLRGPRAPPSSCNGDAGRECNLPGAPTLHKTSTPGSGVELQRCERSLSQGHGNVSTREGPGRQAASLG